MTLNKNVFETLILFKQNFFFFPFCLEFENDHGVVKFVLQRLIKFHHYFDKLKLYILITIVERLEIIDIFVFRNNSNFWIF